VIRRDTTLADAGDMSLILFYVLMSAGKKADSPEMARAHSATSAEQVSQTYQEILSINMYDNNINQLFMSEALANITEIPHRTGGGGDHQRTPDEQVGGWFTDAILRFRTVSYPAPNAFFPYTFGFKVLEEVVGDARRVPRGTHHSPPPLPCMSKVNHHRHHGSLTPRVLVTPIS